jgi:hypothetical protein
MPPSTTFKDLLAPMLAAMVFCATPMPSYALDPKFELDPTVLGRTFASDSPTSSSEVKADAAQRGKTASYALKPKSAVTRRQGRSGPAGKTKNAGKTRKTELRASLADDPLKSASPASGEATALAREAVKIWPQLVPADATGGKYHFDYRFAPFSLSLDQERYPVLPALDGARIMLDGGGTLPPSVKTLIQAKDPQVRFVSDDPASSQRFYRSLLTVAKFYSFEEDFSVDFGTDPKITVRADFKIEKRPDSLLRQDIALLNVSENRRTMPDALIRLLAQSGFQLVDARLPSGRKPGVTGDMLYQVSAKEPKEIVDSILEALFLPVEKEKTIDLYYGENIGVWLEVPVDRYFEDQGQRYVVAIFNGDPARYTLVRLLEKMGYRVIMLQEADDFHKIADKMLSCMQIPGRYEEHDLWPARNAGYGVRMSGAVISGSRNGYRNLFITDRNLDPLVKELVILNGYHLLTQDSASNFAADDQQNRVDHDR